MTLPISVVMVFASTSLLRRSAAAKLASRSARRCTESLRKPAKLLAERLSTRSVSASVNVVKLSIGSPVDGFTVLNVVGFMQHLGRLCDL